MGKPAVKLNDLVTGQCGQHQIPAPNGAPTPSPAPLPFSAPMTDGLTSTVKIQGVEAAVQGSGGLNTPSHVGLHTSDPQFSPNDQKAELSEGSGTVFFDGKPAAYSGCKARICVMRQGTVNGTAATVLIGS